MVMMAVDSSNSLHLDGSNRNNDQRQQQQQQHEEDKPSTTATRQHHHHHRCRRTPTTHPSLIRLYFIGLVLMVSFTTIFQFDFYYYFDESHYNHHHHGDNDNDYEIDYYHDRNILLTDDAPPPLHGDIDASVTIHNNNNALSSADEDDYEYYYLPLQTPPPSIIATQEIIVHNILREFRNYLMEDYDNDNYKQKTMFLQNLITNITTEQQPHHYYRCPLDWLIFNSTISNNYCIQRRSSSKAICRFEGLIFKRIKKPTRWDYYIKETKTFQLLTSYIRHHLQNTTTTTSSSRTEDDENNLFIPKLYYKNDQCMTTIQENIKPFHGKNIWTADYTYYETFFMNVFKIFISLGIQPHDLNLCCNTIANGQYIKIFDFDRYKFVNYDNDVPNEESLIKQNQEYLNKLLKQLKELTKMKYDNNNIRPKNNNILFEIYPKKKCPKQPRQSSLALNATDNG